MANVTLNTRLIQRNDSAENWLSVNPVLKKGELGIEIDTRKFKVGNGTSTWTELPYAVDFDNVDAEHVWFNKDLITTCELGNIKLVNGQATIPSKGKNLKEVFDLIFVRELNPKTTQPSVGINCPEARAYEVGTPVTPTYTTNFTPGAYTFGPETGVTATKYTATDNAGNSPIEAASGTFGQLVVGDTTNYQITIAADYSEGAMPVTNLGNAYAAGKILAGTKRAVSGAITGYRAWFCGSSSSNIALTSEGVRGLVNKGAVRPGVFEMPVLEGAKEVLIAVPAGYTVNKVEDQNAFGTDIVTSFVQQVVSVEGANHYEVKPYNVYLYKPAAALGANTYKITIA